MSDDVTFGKDVVVSEHTNLYGCTIGDNTKIGAFVEIQKGAVVGKNCKISSHTFICEGVYIGDGCFIGHGVMFINDKYPKATNKHGDLETEDDWKKRFLPTRVHDNVSIGSNATIMCGVTIGENAMIGAGSVVIENVPTGCVVVGNPARYIRGVIR